MSEKIVVCGAGGYVGRHLVAALVKQGHEVCTVSREATEFPGAHTNAVGNLLDVNFCKHVCHRAKWVYNLAATVGGIGYIDSAKARCMSSAAININLLRSLDPDVLGYFFASSSCVYPSLSRPLTEADVSPGGLEGYGLEKYFSEQTAQAFAEEYGIPVRIARLHTVYGPDDFRGFGRDHFPSAMALQVVEAVRSGNHDIKIWGDGTQTRSLLYIDDAVEGIQKIMGGGVGGAVNLASSEVVSVNGIVDMLEEMAAVKLNRFYCPKATIGAQNKTADTRELRARYSWEPTTPSRVGIGRLYRSAWDRGLKE